jgi:hypothetical protein
VAAGRNGSAPGLKAMMFTDELSEHRRRLASELRALAATPRGRGVRGMLLSSADQLDCTRVGGRAGRSIFLVTGEEISDGTGAKWVVCGFQSMRAAEGLVSELTATARAFGKSIGNEELVGLEHVQRRELESHLRRMDESVKVGRHGVRWHADQSTLKNE